MHYEFTCKTGGERTDKFLALQDTGITRSAAAALIEQGCCLVNGKIAAKNQKLKTGDIVTLDVPEAQPADILPENIPLDIVYEDSDLLVVNKPKGMVVHPAPGHYSGTLVNALMYHCGDSLSGINGVIRPGIVHRIDRDTSGLLIVAKNDTAHNILAEQIKVHSFTREYMAVVQGVIKENGTVDAPIGRHPVDRKRMAVTPKNSKPAVTHYEVIARYRGYTRILCRLETGRTHQIRVHMASIGHPLLGDGVYGAPCPEKGLEGQCLHARRLKFIHPRTGQLVRLEAPLPEYFTQVISRLGNEI